MKLRTIEQIKNLSGKIALLRTDYNVPVRNGQVADDFKIVKSLPTIKYLLKKGARVVVMSHLGRPKNNEKKFSLSPVAKRLGELLKREIGFFKFSQLAKKGGIGNRKVVMMENVRFLKGEEENDKDTARQLAGLADIFVLDGFAVAHRDAASVSGVAKLLPSYAGLLLEEEVAMLTMAIDKPKRPLVVILGGAKADTKIPVIKNLLPKADKILLGGGLTSTYWWAKGHKLGGSILSKECKKEILQYGVNKKIIMPVDVVVGRTDGTDARVMGVDKKLQIRDKNYGVFDIGPETIKLFSRHIRTGATLIWNGPMGWFEVPIYSFGTKAVAQLFASRSKGKALGVTGGGETVEFLRAQNLLDYIDLVSTGGGALLEFLSGKKLPGIEAVREK